MNRYICSKCGKPLDKEPQNLVWQQVVGWEHRRSAGGTNHVALRQTQEIFMCHTCMTRLQAGIPVEQQTLL